MRIDVIEAEGVKIAVRGKIRRTAALESVYLLNLKATHPVMKPIIPDTNATSSESLAARDPNGWSLMGVANNFRLIAARCAWAELPGEERFEEPFTPEEIVALFNHWLDTEELPDKSDVWSQVAAAIERMDAPEQPADPLAEKNTPTG